MNDQEHDTAFRELVRAMREAQKKYFRTRDTAELEKSKKLEREVDRALRAPAPDPRQGVLPLLPAPPQPPRGRAPVSRADLDLDRKLQWTFDNLERRAL